MVDIYKRVDNVNGKARFRYTQTLTLATPAAAVTPTGGANPSCQHPSICSLEDGGFACFWERIDTTIPATTMTVGGLQIEMCKLVPTSSGYVIKGSNTPGKGYVLDNTVIAGDAGGTPRCAWRRGNQVGVVYGHQLTYSLAVDDAQRTWAVRAAYLDFTPNGKPTFLLGGNRTGGSVSDEADGGYVAGTIATALVTGIDLDDDTDTPVFSVGGGLPFCIFDMRGDFMVAYEVRNGKAGTGGIVVRTFKGPSRGSDATEANCGMNVAALYSSTADHAASVGFAARRPVLAFRNVFRNSLALSGTNHPPILLVYGDQDPTGAVKATVKAKTITFPLNSNTPTIASLTVPTNTNYDATADDQSLAFCVDSAFITAAFLQEQLAANASDGRKFKVVHSDNTGEILYARGVEQPTRPNAQAAILSDGAKVLALTYEGQDAAGSGSEKVFLELWQFA